MRKMLYLLFLIPFACTVKEDGSDKVPAKSVVQLLAKEVDLNAEVMKQPSDILSVLSPIELEFRSPLIPQHLVGVDIFQKIFLFDPPLKGSIKWLSTRHIQFKPEKQMLSGTNYQGKFIGKQALGENRMVNDFSFIFKTAEQEVVGFEGDFSPLPEFKNTVMYMGVFNFAQPVSHKKIEESISAELDGKKLNVRIKEAEKTSVKVTFEFEKLKRKASGQTITVTLSSAYNYGNDPWEKKILLPAIHDFKVLSHLDLSEPGKAQGVYGFRFSDPIKKGMDLSGYIELEGLQGYQVSTKGKYLNIQGNFNPGKSYKITIKKGFPSALGTKLLSDYFLYFSLKNINPKIEWLSRGVYLPPQNDFKLQFKSVNVGKAKVTVTEVFKKNLGFFIQSNVIKEKKKNDHYWGTRYSDLNRVGKKVIDTTLQISKTRNGWVQSEIDLKSVLARKKNSAIIVSITFDQKDLVGKCVTSESKVNDSTLYFADDYYKSPCYRRYYYQNGTLSKSLISSNVGLTVKKAGKQLLVFANNIEEAKPVPNLNLTLYGYQNQILKSFRTDNMGMVKFPSKDAYYIMGENKSGLALIQLKYPRWETSSFDVSGTDGGMIGTNAFMYTDRGVHRPGDSIHLSAIIRNDGKPLPKDHPVLIKVKNPKSQTIFESKVKAGVNSHVSFSIPTTMDDPTGSYQTILTVGDKDFYKSLKVETVKPNRLKIEIASSDSITSENLTIQGELIAKYLFGAPGSNLKANLKLQLSNKYFYPRKFKDFKFNHPQKKMRRDRIVLVDDKLDNHGKAVFSKSLGNLQGAPGLVEGILKSKVTEKGGGFTTKNKWITIFPYSHYVGIKSNIKWNYGRIGDKYHLEIVSTDVKGNAIKGRTLKIKKYLNQYHWWWDYDGGNRRDFRTKKHTRLIEEEIVLSESKPIKVPFEIEDRGLHLFEVIDESSGHSTAYLFQGTSWGSTPVKDDKPQSFLTINSDKNNYHPGDEVTLQFESPQSGMALFTLEQGNRVLTQKVQTIKSNRTELTFKYSKEMVPNVYAVVSFIQPHNQNTNDLPMRIYGIKKLHGEDPDTKLPLTMDAPDVIKPNHSFKLSITSKAKTKGTYTLAVVDEGLLSLTNFKSPNPIDHFFKKIRLGVNTLDNYNEILGTLYPDMDQLFAIGGGDMRVGARARGKMSKRLGVSKAKRFKPVVLFQKPMEISPGETQNLSFNMPNYVGAVRTMVVASSGPSFASLDKTIEVKQPLMILTTVPRISRPKDQFAVPVSVFVTESNMNKVKVKIQVSDNLKIKDDSEKSITFDNPGEKDLAFNLEAGESIGTGKIIISAVSGIHQTQDTISLPLESANPFFTKVTDTSLMKEGSLTLVPKKVGIDGTNKAYIGFTNIPDLQLRKRLNYLIGYPYGCIEQTVSKAMPQLFIPSLIELNSRQEQDVTDNIHAAIEKLKRFIIPSGGFSYWPVNHYSRYNYSKWGSNYAGHFLLEAKGLGYHVPKSLISHWRKYANTFAKSVNKKNHRYQTYNLFLLALSGKPHFGGMNLLKEDYLNNMDPLSKHFLAAAYYLAGQKDIAKQILKFTQTEITSYRELSGTYGSSLRDMSMIAYLALKMEDIKGTAKLIQKVAKQFKPNGWYSTQETATALLALGTLYKKSPGVGGHIPLTVKVPGEKTKQLTLKGYQEVLELSNNSWGKNIEISSKGNNPVFIYLYEEGIPLEDVIKTGHQNLNMTRNLYSTEGQPMTMASIKQGEPFWIRYEVQSSRGEKIEELALSSMFPAGWEVINPRMETTPSPQWVKNLRPTQGTYMDIRDDRVNWFFDVNGYNKKNFVIKINPTFKGTYRLPPVVLEAMYSPDYYARIRGGETRVK